MRTPKHEELLEYYRRELAYLRKMGAAFAARYPKVAHRLELGPDECPDPHVERMIEAFAFVTGRVQYNIESELLLLTAPLLDILYPHYLNPIPSMAVAHFAVDPAQGQFTGGHPIPKHTPLFAESPQGLTCRFHTCYPVVLWPLDVARAEFESPDRFDFLEPNVAHVLRLRIESRGASLAELELDRLRFYLNGDQVLVSRLYELLFAHVLRVALLPEDSSTPLYLPPESILPVGFDSDEEVLPYPRHSHPAYRLIQEYFHFPEKFLFFDLDHLDLPLPGTSFDLLFLLDEPPRERLTVERRNFLLGCTPIVNLFTRTSEPLRIDRRRLEYRLVADIRHESSTEIHSILRVSMVRTPGDTSQDVEPYFSFDHHAQRVGQEAFWFARREPCERKDLLGTDMHLSFVDLDFNPELPPTETIFAHVRCTNRHVAEMIPAGALLEIEEAAPLAHIACVDKPTPQVTPPLGGAALWRLISHLSLNYLSLSEGEAGLRALKEILKLYCFSDRPSTYQQVAGLRRMTSRPVVRRIGTDAWRGFCRGLEIEIEFDESLYLASDAFLLASVLNRFLALYASVNSFTQLVATSVQREGVWKRWPPVAGEQVVL